MKKITVIVQARCGSTRFPNKVLKRINKLSLIEIIFRRLKKSKQINDFFLATTKNKSDNCLVKLFSNSFVKIFRGKTNDVLSRYYYLAKKNKSEIIVRVTGDCPLIDVNLIDKMILILKNKKLDYVSNTIKHSYPNGFDAEVFTNLALKKVWKNSKTSFEKEHVTPYFRSAKTFKIYNLSYKENLSEMRLSVDEPKDFKLIKKIFRNFEDNIHFTFSEVIRFIKKIKKT